MSEHPTWQRSLGDYTSAVKAEIRGRAFCGIPFLDETATGVSDRHHFITLTHPPLLAATGLNTISEHNAGGALVVGYP